MVRFWIHFEGRADITWQWKAHTARGVALATGRMGLVFPEKGETENSRLKPVLAGGQFGLTCPPSIRMELLCCSFPHLNTRSHEPHFCPIDLPKGSQTGFALSCVQAFVCAVLSAKKSVPASLRSESLTGSSCTDSSVLLDVPFLPPRL